MRNFSEIVDEAARALQRKDPVFREVLEDAVRRRYKQVLRSAGWEAKQSRADITVAADSDLLVLPSHMKDVISVYNTTSSKYIQPRGVEQLARDYSGSDSWEEVYAKERVSSWNGVSFGTAGGFLRVASSSGADALSVQLKTIDSDGAPYEQSVAISGGSLVTFNLMPLDLNTQEIVSFTKSQDSAGVIRLTNAANANLSVLGTTDRIARYLWLRLSRSVTANTVYRVSYKRAMGEIDSELDVPAIDCGDVLVIGAVADGLRTMQQSQRSLIEEGRFALALDLLIEETELEGQEHRQASGSMDEYRRF